jgi:AraC-like DNA-binding protein
MGDVRIQITVAVDSSQEVFAPIIRALIERMGQLSWQAAAELARMSPYHFSHESSKVFGESFQAVRRRIRLHLAATLLIQTRLRIHEVAERVGYQSIGVFERRFKQAYEVTPSDYRSRNFATPVLVFRNSETNGLPPAVLECAAEPAEPRKTSMIGV